MENLLGKKPEKVNLKDAIHTPIISAIAKERLRPGQRVSIRGESNPKGIGIVDPFLSRVVECNELFWICIQPGTITSIKHDWTHPDLKEEIVQELKEIALQLGISFEELIYNGQAVASGNLSDQCFSTTTASEILSNNEDLQDRFWSLFEQFTEQKVPKEIRPYYFRCAC